MKRDQHLITPLIRQLFGEQSTRADRSHFEGHDQRSRRRFITSACPPSWMWSYKGCLACRRHADTLLAINDSGPEESSKVTSALLLMSAQLANQELSLLLNGALYSPVIISESKPIQPATALNEYNRIKELVHTTPRHLLQKVWNDPGFRPVAPSTPSFVSLYDSLLLCEKCSAW